MVIIEFVLKDQTITIQAKWSDRFEKVLRKLKNKTKIEIDNLCFLSNGKIIQENDTLKQIMNETEKQNNKMIITVSEQSKIESNGDNILKKNDIICPECKEQCECEIKTYRIKLYDCVNGHKIKNINLNKYINIPNIDISCDKCLSKKKKSYNGFYSCYECNMNLCCSCKSKHYKTHTFINYESCKNYEYELEIAKIDSIKISCDKENQSNNIELSQNKSEFKINNNQIEKISSNKFENIYPNFKIYKQFGIFEVNKKKKKRKYNKTTEEKNINENQIISKGDLNNIKGDLILGCVFNFLTKGKILKLIKYNNNIKERLDIRSNDYKDYCAVEIEIIPEKNKYDKFINIQKDRSYFHIYFNDEKEEKKDIF